MTQEGGGEIFPLSTVLQRIPGTSVTYPSTSQSHEKGKEWKEEQTERGQQTSEGQEDAARKPTKNGRNETQDEKRRLPRQDSNPRTKTAPSTPTSNAANKRSISGPSPGRDEPLKKKTIVVQRSKSRTPIHFSVHPDFLDPCITVPTATATGSAGPTVVAAPADRKRRHVRLPELVRILAGSCRERTGSSARTSGRRVRTPSSFAQAPHDCVVPLTQPRGHPRAVRRCHCRTRRDQKADASNQ